MSFEPEDLLDRVEGAFRQYFQLVPDRASVSFVGVQQIEILRFGDPGRHAMPSMSPAATHYLSLGMSRYPMLDSSASHVDDPAAPRAELLVTVTGESDGLWQRLAVLAAAPAVEGAVYQAGGRLHLGEALMPGSRCVGGVLVAGALPAISVPGLADVQVLQLLPATATELAWARVHGSSALRQRWVEHGTLLSDLMRDPVDLEA